MNPIDIQKENSDDLVSIELRIRWALSVRRGFNTSLIFNWFKIQILLNKLKQSIYKIKTNEDSPEQPPSSNSLSNIFDLNKWKGKKESKLE